MPFRLPSGLAAAASMIVGLMALGLGAGLLLPRIGQPVTTFQPGTTATAAGAPSSSLNGTAGLICPPPARAMARLELLFGAGTSVQGTSIQGLANQGLVDTVSGSTRIVGETDWLAFVDAQVTPRFPDGLTVLTGLGQWRNSQGRIARETSRLLLIWHVPGPATEAHITAIREAYKAQFAQESVMRVDGVGCVRF